MAYYALLNYNNIVTQVVTGKNEDETNYNMELVYQDMFKQVCKRTSYNTQGGVHSNGDTPFRKNYASVGYTYDANRDAFIPPKPYESWALNEASCLWESPIEYPTDVEMYTWNEDNQQWKLIS